MNIVLYQPEIPGNTGAVGRTCVALEAKLWLVRPLGFRIDEKTLRRAGLDYWKYLEWEVVDHWDHMMRRLSESAGTQHESESSEAVPTEPEIATVEPNLWLYSRFATQSFTEVTYQKGDTLVFGCETAGLPESITAAHSEKLLRIPTGQHVRSLNLSCSVGVAGFEASRQIGGLE
ncbi:tRNA (cytidine(34)-2'-O)-methyltransferase [Mariniblastus sp.]|nr:tRNA (cytidine(34)-2'-O)-methyltransferase [Mariniblastus sp.]